MEKKRPKPKKKEKRGDDEGPTKQQKAVATHLRFNVPTKSTNFHGEDVHYFTGSSAVDCLMESNWKTGKKKCEILFTNKATCINYMQSLLDIGMFWRARKLIPKRKERQEGTESKDPKKKKQQKEKEGDQQDTEEPEKEKTKKQKKKESNGEHEENDKEQEDQGKKEGSKKKKKMKLDFHQEQLFKDGPDVYVWHFDPTPWTKFLLGLGIVVGSIVLCLFPLWPPWMRLGVYYVSVVAMGFVGVLIGLIVLRSVVFGVVWAATWGKHYLWILPNLTEDCGVLESFKPFYSHKYVGDAAGKDDKEKKKKKEKDSSSEGENKEGEGQNTDTDREGESEADSQEESVAEESSAPGTPSQDQGSARKRKAKRKDEGNGFEIVEGPENSNE